MDDRSSELFQQRIARVTGVLFLLSLFVPMLNWVLVNAKLIVPGNADETFRRVVAQGGLFRLGLVGDLWTAGIAVGLATGLYLLLRPVHRGWALAAFGLKLVEGVLMAAIALGNSAVFLVASEPGMATAAPGLGHFVGELFLTRMPLAAFPMFFLGWNFAIFLSLLYRSGLVPRWLAGFGVVSYVLILVYSLLTLLLPEVASVVAIQSLCWAPSCLFELAIGGWLLTKGVAAAGP
jgi:hypothetical protein